jgi:hypothetical protein
MASSTLPTGSMSDLGPALSGYTRNHTIPLEFIPNSTRAAVSTSEATQFITELDWLSSIFNGEPRAWAGLAQDSVTGHFSVVNSGRDDGGNVTFARDAANAAGSVLNSFIDAIGGKSVQGDTCIIATVIAKAISTSRAISPLRSNMSNIRGTKLSSIS